MVGLNECFGAAQNQRLSWIKAVIGGPGGGSQSTPVNVGVIDCSGAAYSPRHCGVDQISDRRNVCLREGRESDGISLSAAFPPFQSFFLHWDWVPTSEHRLGRGQKPFCYTNNIELRSDSRAPSRFRLLLSQVLDPFLIETDKKASAFHAYV